MFEDLKKAEAAAAPSPAKGFFVGELPESGAVTGLAAVGRCEMRETKQGKPFLALTLADCTGQVDAKDFDNAVEHEPVFEPGTIVKIKAKVDAYQGQPQLIIEKARPAKPEECDAADFTPRSAWDIDAMYAGLGRIVESVGDAWLRKLLGEVMCRYSAAWRSAPGAMKIHHAYIGGLLEHVLSMCRAACALCSHYTRLNRDVLIAGCVLHDIGKMREIAAGLTFEQTTTGKLVGHIAEGLLMLEECCAAVEGFPEQTRLLLRHLIVSHHGNPEWGALKLPMTPEAIALSFLDDFDAKLAQAFRLIDTSDGADFSAWDRSLGREVYCVRNE